MLLSNEEKVRQALEVKPYMLIMMEHFDFVLTFFVKKYRWDVLFGLIGELLIMFGTLILSPILVPILAYGKYSAMLAKVNLKSSDITQLKICYNCSNYHFSQCCLNESIPVNMHPAKTCGDFSRVDKVE